MHGEEAARAAAFGRIAAILCMIGLGLQNVYEGHPKLRIAMAVAQSALGATGAWVWFRARNPLNYSKWLFRLFGITSALASIVFMHFLGVFSPSMVAVVLGLSFFGVSEDFVVAVGAGMFVALAYLVSALLVTLKIIPDYGLFQANQVPLPAKIAMLCMVTFVIVMQIWQARHSRQTMREAIERSNNAVKLANAREAQLVEAKENLDAALKAGAGRASGMLAGRFLLEEVVGRGAMGEVYAAREGGGAGPRAAVKILNIARRDDPDIQRRFVRETEIALRVRGDNLVHVHEVGTAQDGSPYIAMELLEGTDLAAILRERPVMPLGEVLTLVTDVGRGLEVLHGAGVVHRDLKPQNLFLATVPRPIWKILDYGVSKLFDGGATLTEGQLVGTPGYMSPEQAQGQAVDPRSDVFALGAVAYRALTGRRPFTGSDTPQLLYQVVYSQPIRPRELMPYLPRDVELVLAIALAKKADERFRTSIEFAAALAEAANGALADRHRQLAAKILRASPWSRDPAHAQSRTKIEVPAPRTARL
jgi:serine/threonine-protein kinase